MTIKAVTKYETPDGKVFTSEIEAEGHVEYLNIGGAIEAYCAAQGLVASEATRAKKYISGYSAFFKTYTGPVALPAPAAPEAANDDQAQAAA